MARTARYTKVLKLVKDADDLSRCGAIVINGSEAKIFFLWGQPIHAQMLVGNEVLQGAHALKSIALELPYISKVEWRNDEMVQLESLHISASELHASLAHLISCRQPETKLPATKKTKPVTNEGSTTPILEEPQPTTALQTPLSVATTDRSNVEYKLDDFPLLPSGNPLWSEVPSNVVNLNVLLKNGPTVLLTLKHEDVLAAEIVISGEPIDALWIDNQGTTKGKAAIKLIEEARNGTISAWEIDALMAEALPLLWHSRVEHRDLDKRWISAKRFFESLTAEGDDFAVIVATSTEVGIALFVRGLIAGAYTTQSREPIRSLEKIYALFQEHSGVISVLVPDPEEETEPLELAGRLSPSEVGGSGPLTLVDPEIPPDNPPSTQISTTPSRKSVEVENEPSWQLVDNVVAESLSDFSAEFSAPTEPSFTIFSTSGPAVGVPTPKPKRQSTVPPLLTFSPNNNEVDNTRFSTANPEIYTPEGAAEEIVLPPLPTLPLEDTSTTDEPNVEDQPVLSADYDPFSPGPRAIAAVTPIDPFGSIVEDLVVIAKRHIGSNDTGVIERTLRNAEPSIIGLRSAIASLRRIPIANHDVEELNTMFRAMLNYMGDNLTAI